MRVIMLGIGTAVPRYSIAQEDAAEFAKSLCGSDGEQTRLLPALYLRTRVQRRGSVLLEPGPLGSQQSFFPDALDGLDRGPTTQARMRRYATDATPLAVAASQRALAASHLAPSVITQVVTVSCTGFSAPGVDAALIYALGLSAQVGRTHVGFMGCHGFFNGLRVARALAAQDPAARVLVCAVELCSVHHSYGWDLEQAIANALFADGAAAMVVGASSSTDRSSWELAASGSCVFPDSTEAMSWAIGDHGFMMTLSVRVPALIAEHLRPWLESWLTAQGLTIGQVGSWAVHPGGPRILSAVAASLGLPDQTFAASWEVLAEHGNMSSPTIAFILARVLNRDARRPCVALGFGPGLAVEAMLIR